jgi:hypothetical protein
LGAQSHPSYTGFAWYRERVEIDNANGAGTKKLAVLIPRVQDAYEIFWNGQKLATYGRLPPMPSGGNLATGMSTRCPVPAGCWHCACGKRP